MLDRLKLSFGSSESIFLQSEAAECGLACLGMISAHFGFRTDMLTLRQRFPVSLKGLTLQGLAKVGGKLNLSSRAVKLEIHELRELKLPCILHWDLKHFVVLVGIKRGRYIVFDPAGGRRNLSEREMSSSFTGVALELWPTSEFVQAFAQKKVALRGLIGRTFGFRRSIMQIVCVSLALETCALLAPLFVQVVVDDVLPVGQKAMLPALGAAFLTLLLAQTGFTWARSWMSMYLSTSMSVQWQGNVFSHLLHLPFEFFSKRNQGDVVARFGSINVIQQTITGAFLTVFMDGLFASITLVMMFFYDVRLTILVLCGIIAYSIFRILRYSPLENAKRAELTSSARVSSHFLESVKGARAIKTFQKEGERKNAWMANLVEATNNGLAIQKLNITSHVVNSLLFGVQGVMFIWFGAVSVLDGQLTVGALMALNAYRTQFNNRISSLVDKAFEFKLLGTHAERLADIVLADAESQAGDATKLDSSKVNLEVKDLNFRYSETDSWTLQGVSFSVTAGETLAITGVSGVGKSTLLALLGGVMQPSSGRILINGHDVKSIGLEQHREVVGAVFQDDVLFAGTVLENIAFFADLPDERWAMECARISSVSEDIQAMPMGYNTLVGDMGSSLSGGQKQRILLARALYKRPQVLLLDEATSHLDAVNESNVNSRIEALKITKIIVAHRKETICSADRVFTLRHAGLD